MKALVLSFILDRPVHLSTGDMTFSVKSFNLKHFLRRFCIQKIKLIKDPMKFSPMYKLYDEENGWK